MKEVPLFHIYGSLDMEPRVSEKYRYIKNIKKITMLQIKVRLEGVRYVIHVSRTTQGG